MSWGKRLLLVFIILFGLSYGVLKLAERNTDSIRKGLEDAIAQATGHPAQVTEMVTVKLVPDIILRMKGVSVVDKADNKKGLISAEKAYVAIPFWKMMTGQKEYSGFEIQGLEVASGYYLPEKLTASFVGISDPAPEKSSPPVMIFEGNYNGHPLLITADMRRDAAKKHYLYGFAPSFPFTFKLGATEADGLIARSADDVSLKGVQAVRGDDRAEFVVRDMDSKPLNAKIEGTINDQAFNATLTKSGQDAMLTITPHGGTDILKIKPFIDGVQKDFGLEKDKGHLTVKFNDPQKTETP